MTSDVEKIIGANLQEAREAAGISQTALALTLRDAGYKWSQPTVVAVEKGERSLRLSEASVIAKLLGLGIADRLTGVSDYYVSEEVRELRAFKSRVLRAVQQTD